MKLATISYRMREMLPLRVIKTSLSVFLAAILAQFFGFESTLFAGLGAVKSMGFSVQESFETMKNQIIANAAAAVVGIAVAYVIGVSPFSAGVGIFIVLSALNYFNLKGTHVMAGITLCSILLASDTAATVVYRAYDRFTLMSIGLIVSFLVNILIFRPNYQMKVDEYLKSLTMKTHDFLKLAKTGTLNLDVLKVIKSEYQLLQRYVFAAKSDENIAERFRYEHVQQLSALQLYLVETDIKIKLLERLSQLDWIDLSVYAQIETLFAIEVLVEQELTQAPVVRVVGEKERAEFQTAYISLFTYFEPYISYENEHAQEAIRILDLISMYKTKTEQLFTLIDQSKGV